jgi:hypothetical protein
MMIGNRRWLNSQTLFRPRSVLSIYTIFGYRSLLRQAQRPASI